MTERISLIEQYDNRDIIAQVYRIISLVESSTIVRTTSVQEGSTVTVTLEMYDGTTKQFTFTNNADMTTDTEQNVTALKNFLAGLNVTGNTQIDGETQIVNGHSLQVAGDLDVGGDTELAGRLTAHGQSEIAGMAIEESSGATVLSNANGIKSASPVAFSGDVTVPTTVTGQRDTKAANGTRLQNDLDAYPLMVRTTNDQTIAGNKKFTSPIYVERTNPLSIYTDTRDYADLTTTSTCGGIRVVCKDGEGTLALVEDTTRVSGFGVSGGVERMMWTRCKAGEETLSVILRVQINPSTRKAVLRFGNTNIAEVDV